MPSFHSLIDPSRWLTPERLGAAAEESLVPRPEEVEVRGRGPLIDEKSLGELLSCRMRDWKEARPKSDAALSLAVRQALPLDRRAAADRGLWTYLNVTVGWPYVVWRWRSDAYVTKGRVHGNLDRSALARLWWMAELTHGRGLDAPRDPDAWRVRIEKLLGWQDRAVQLYERPRLFSRERLAPALIEAAGRDALGEGAFRDFALSCAGYFGVRLPMAMSRSRIEGAVDRLARLAAGERE